MADQLARRPDRRRELGAIDDHVEPALEQSDEVLRRVALHPARVDVVLLELLLGDVAVIALELLLGSELDAIVADLALPALAMLAGAIFAAVHRALGTSEDVLAHAAVELVFGAGALRHVSFSNSRFVCAPGTAPPSIAPDAITASPGMRDQLRSGGLREELRNKQPLRTYCGVGPWPSALPGSNAAAVLQRVQFILCLPFDIVPVGILHAIRAWASVRADIGRLIALARQLVSVFRWRTSLWRGRH